jgi:hypothetical protein
MKINWADFLRHLGVQIGAAMITAAVTSLAGYNYSELGAFAPIIQGVAALATTAWNTFEKNEGI